MAKSYFFYIWAILQLELEVDEGWSFWIDYDWINLEYKNLCMTNRNKCETDVNEKGIGILTVLVGRQ